jgi:hypothetical protein
VLIGARRLPHSQVDEQSAVQHGGAEPDYDEMRLWIHRYVRLDLTARCRSRARRERSRCACSGGASF